MDNDVSPITDPRLDRRYQACKCHRCGATEKCSPSFDFYEPVSSPGILICEDCMTIEIHSARRK